MRHASAVTVIHMIFTIAVDIEESGDRQPQMNLRQSYSTDWQFPRRSGGDDSVICHWQSVNYLGLESLPGNDMSADYLKLCTTYVIKID
jgi:hypothetical protein